MNIRDIARLANVTPGTVSKVLNNYPTISEATRTHVLKIIEENQYIPARMLKVFSPAPHIGIITEGVYNEVYTKLEELLSIRLHNADYTIMSYTDNYYVQDKSEKFQELITYAANHQLSGIIYMGGNFEELTQEQFNELPCPTIFINTVLPTHIHHDEYSSIQVNHFETAYKQMNYLIEKGHQNICTVISSLNDNSVYGIRFKGYKVSLSENGLTHNLEHVLEGDYNYERTHLSLTKYLKEHPEITAVCCVADIVAPAVSRAIHDAGKLPGKDIDIISFDGLPVANYCIPSITTFEQPCQELVNCTYELLLGLISREREHQHITFQSKFIKNESC